MSVEAMTAVLHHSRARGTARLVLLGIANHEGEGGSWPTVETLAKYAGGIHERNVQRALTTLESSGEVSVVRQRGGMGDLPEYERPNLYRVLVCCPPECDGSLNHRVPKKQRRAPGGGNATG